ncbi:DL-endopeptidase inhibitor IseA family protein [Brevibacillus centrosporus]|uniref:DL-endopeptidase inhibitor IseA family protein n=1 Tax=Brevibacillus centrosporus TaxID=54910 RepID=UPI00382D85FA
MTVKKQGDKWFIDKYTPVTFRTDMNVVSEILTNETALGLVAEAQRRYWYISAGGSGSPFSRFKPIGAEYDYRWLSEDIDTKEKLQHYLEDLFSTPTVTTYISDLFAKKQIIEEVGKLAQPEADGGSMRQWESAKVAKLEQKGKTAKVTMVVSVGEDDSETFEIDFVHQEKNGWKIATTPQIIR